MDDAWDHSDKRGRVIRWFKKNIHQNIDGGFIRPLRTHRYPRDLGFERDRLVFGVDVVDNAFFSARAEAARAARDDIRARLRLPEKYFLLSAASSRSKVLQHCSRHTNVTVKMLQMTRGPLCLSGMGKKDVR